MGLLEVVLIVVVIVIFMMISRLSRIQRLSKQKSDEKDNRPGDRARTGKRVKGSLFGLGFILLSIVLLFYATRMAKAMIWGASGFVIFLIVGIVVLFAFRRR
jgi:hypothetical protein